MVRGTTPTYTLTFPFAVSTLSTLYITFGQCLEGTSIEKALADCTVSGNSATVSLTQAETLRLSADRPLYIQIRAKTTGDVAYASPMSKLDDVYDIIKEGVI